MLRKFSALFFFSVAASLAMPTWARSWNARTDWGATGNGKTDDYRAIQRGVAAMGSGDTVVFPAPGSYYMGSTVFFKASGIRVKCQPGAMLVGPQPWHGYLRESPVEHGHRRVSHDRVHLQWRGHSGQWKRRR